MMGAECTWNLGRSDCQMSSAKETEQHSDTPGVQLQLYGFGVVGLTDLCVSPGCYGNVLLVSPC